MNTFKFTSKAGVGAVIVTLMEVVLPLIGLDSQEGTAANVVDAVATLVGFALLLYGQFDRKDLEYGLFRKDS